MISNCTYLVTSETQASIDRSSLSLRVAPISWRASGTARGLSSWLRAELVGETVAAVFGLPLHGEWPATDATIVTPAEVLSAIKSGDCWSPDVMGTICDVGG